MKKKFTENQLNNLNQEELIKLVLSQQKELEEAIIEALTKID